MPILPTLFVSHGAPTLPLTDADARRFLETLVPRCRRVLGRSWWRPRIGRRSVRR
jgi:aromatic ring-opening dioxygenase catalytic subunit (LigB family)